MKEIFCLKNLYLSFGCLKAKFGTLSLSIASALPQGSLNLDKCTMEFNQQPPNSKHIT